MWGATRPCDSSFFACSAFRTTARTLNPHSRARISVLNPIYPDTPVIWGDVSNPYLTPLERGAYEDKISCHDKL